jgi:hypothetical protein
MKEPEDSRSGGWTWLDMVDWGSAHVGNTRSGVSRSIQGYTQKPEGEVHRQHPARTWVEWQEPKSRGHEPEQIPTTSECHLLHVVTNLKQGADALSHFHISISSVSSRSELHAHCSHARLRSRSVSCRATSSCLRHRCKWRHSSCATTGRRYSMPVGRVNTGCDA